MTDRRTRLAQLTHEFLDAFNRFDLEAAMEFFSEDGVYEEFNGHRNAGHTEVRAAFEPQFAGAFGDMKFLDEDLFIDADTGKVMASWLCTLDVHGHPTSWHGLDLIYWDDDDHVTHKLTYAKAKVPLFDPAVPKGATS
ncbi:nuclear transport factor 2 family protein [Candidatus Poriferisodalis sp.]|uniref:nuclear transport factor 2 family protein n=1 Tax=Candidatus Poriferisodalis sp. TaxID=3101277 RepID=UPI003AF99611